MSNPVETPCLEPADFYQADSYQAGESIGWLLRTINQSIIRQVGRRLLGCGLTHAQWTPLIRLHFCGQSTAAALAKELDLDAGAMTRLLDRLEAKGLVSRERSATDRRVLTLALTAEGRRITQQLPALFSEIFNLHLSGFSHEEWRTLIGLLKRVQLNGEALRRADGGEPLPLSTGEADESD